MTLAERFAELYRRISAAVARNGGDPRLLDLAEMALGDLRRLEQKQ